MYKCICDDMGLLVIANSFHQNSYPKAVIDSLQSGLALSMRSIVMMGTYVTATSLIAGLGATTLAASEILRQVIVLPLLIPVLWRQVARFRERENFHFSARIIIVWKGPGCTHMNLNFTFISFQ